MTNLKTNRLSKGSKNSETVARLFSLFLMLACHTGMWAQAPQLLSSNHALWRVTPQQRYLLLPVQEREENAHVRVIVDNQEVKSLNVRLAVDKVDYYVPLELNLSPSLSQGEGASPSPLDFCPSGNEGTGGEWLGGVLLDITFHGDRRTTGSAKDFVCWHEMRQSDTFDTQNRERFRPVYHHTPEYGWMNDPNGMFYKDGVWHLYYQYNPYGSQWENMTWGHSTSRDLIHWDAQPLAIEPDALGAIFSGSCVVAGQEKVVAFYTSAGQNQAQSMAVSQDGGLTFDKYEGNPILTADEPDFRDPKAFWNPDIQRWNLILAVGQEMRIFSSDNLKDWTYESSFGQGLGCHDGVWECPDLFALQVDGSNSSTKKKWVLVCNINPGGPFGGSATQYFVGDFDGHRFTCEHRDTRWMDYGKDHYATVTFDNAPDGRRVALAWMSNWQYANQVPTQQFRSANSVPRDLGLFEHNGQTYVNVTPSRELTALRGKAQKQLTEACEVVVDLKGSADIVLSNAKGEEVVMRYDDEARTFSMDRTKSGNTSFSDAFACTTTAPVYGNMKQLRLFIDKCSIEAFDSEGHMAMTNLEFPSEPYNNIKVRGGKVTIYPMEIKD